MPASSASPGVRISTGHPSIPTWPEVLGVGAEDQTRKLGAAGADETGEPEHLARMDGQASSPSRAARRPCSTAVSTGCPRPACGSCSFL